MNWRFCVDTPEQRALKLCSGSMNAGDGDGHGVGDGYGDGDGYGYGYGDRLGKGSSPQVWR